MFGSQRDGNFDVYTMNADGSDLRRFQPPTLLLLARTCVMTSSNSAERRRHSGALGGVFPDIGRAARRQCDDGVQVQPGPALLVRGVDDFVSGMNIQRIARASNPTPVRLKKPAVWP